MANAQVTLTTNELPYAGMSYGVSEDTVTNISPGNPGTGQVWDFTQLQIQVTDTITFEDAALSPYAAQFPGSNLVAHNSEDSVYAYYTTTQNGFYLDGSYEEASAINAGFHFSPSVTIIPVPFTFGNMHISNAVATFYSTGSGPGFKMVHHQVDTLTGDGAGTLKVPGAIYNNTLRIKVQTTVFDSIFVDANNNGNYMFYSVTQSHRIRYSWFRQGAPSYLFGIELNFTNPAITERVEWITPSGSTSGVNDVSSFTDIDIYPNPASNVIYVNTSGWANGRTTLELFSVTGQKIFSSPVNSQTSINIEYLHLNGLHYYQVISGNQVIKSGKILIQN